LCPSGSPLGHCLQPSKCAIQCHAPGGLIADHDIREQTRFSGILLPYRPAPRAVSSLHIETQRWRFGRHSCWPRANRYIPTLKGWHSSFVVWVLLLRVGTPASYSGCYCPCFPHSLQINCRIIKSTRSVVRQFTDVSEERAAYIFRIQEMLTKKQSLCCYWWCLVWPSLQLSSDYAPKFFRPLPNYTRRYNPQDRTLHSHFKI
jgi:hypothetical protein